MVEGKYGGFDHWEDRAYNRNAHQDRDDYGSESEQHSHW